MSSFVLDASATLAWIFGEADQSQNTDVLMANSELVAPTLWRLEVVNSILSKERQKKITASQGSRYLMILDSLEIDLVNPPANQSLEQLALIARPHQLSSYDAVYLDLAVTLGLPIYSLDVNLQEAAKRVGLKLIV